TAATPPGMEVTVDVRCTFVDGQRTKWEIVARDEVDEIGRGTHERFTVNIDRFNGRVAKKIEQASNVA
ncbi:MAG: thioesterase, partial [Deltaproteobacteria bacterium]|nr:thioesterase [Deltaproteobacteria bacterium]